MKTKVVKFVLAVFLLGMAARVASADVLLSTTYTWTGSESTQTDRLFRDGVASLCSAPKSFPGLFGSGTQLYNTFNVTPGGAGCVRVSWTESSGFNTFLSMYIGSYNPANKAANYLADSGASAPTSPPRVFEGFVGAGQTVVIVANSVFGVAGATGTSFTFTVEGVAGGCPPHRIHGHISTVPPGHLSPIASHEHHNQHGHSGPLVCPPHPPSHPGAPAVEGGRRDNDLPPGPVSRLMDDSTQHGLFSPSAATEGLDVVAGLNQEGTINGERSPAPKPGGKNFVPARRGNVVQLFGLAEGFFLGDGDEQPLKGFTPPASGSPLYFTTGLPEVRIAGLQTRVLFSGLAPGLVGVWQINVLVPEEVPAGRAPVEIFYQGQELKSIPLVVE